MSDPYYLASLMLECAVIDLPPEIYDKIQRLEKLTGRAGGHVYSKQIIAGIVDQYQQKNLLEK